MIKFQCELRTSLWHIFLFYAIFSATGMFLSYIKQSETVLVLWFLDVFLAFYKIFFSFFPLFSGYEFFSLPQPHYRHVSLADPSSLVSLNAFGVHFLWTRRSTEGSLSISYKVSSVRHLQNMCCYPNHVFKRFSQKSRKMQ